jgi:predicted MFS family arabinose efflux permease
MFAIFMMFVNIGTAGGQSVGGILSERLGFGGMALVMGLINLLNIPIVIAVFRRPRQAGLDTGLAQPPGGPAA